jgi:hypothetical protein
MALGNIFGFMINKVSPALFLLTLIVIMLYRNAQKFYITFSRDFKNESSKNQSSLRETLIEIELEDYQINVNLEKDKFSDDGSLKFNSHKFVLILMVLSLLSLHLIRGFT